MGVSTVLPVLALLCVGGCAPATQPNGLVGIHTASSDPPPGTRRPVDPGDPDAVLERARWLTALEQALALAPADMTQAAAAGELWPVTDLDPGGRSGQVVFYRPVSNPKRRGPVAAPWRRVSLSLDPPRVLEVTPLHGDLIRGSREDLRLRAIAAALDIAETEVAGLYHTHALFEQPVGGEVQIRIYVFGHTAAQPDLEIVFAFRKRRPWVVPVSVLEIHPARGRTEAWILTSQPAPSPMTVARVLARHPNAEAVRVRTTKGDVMVSTATGRSSQPAR